MSTKTTARATQPRNQVVQVVPREVARPVASRPTGPRPANSKRRLSHLGVAGLLVVALFTGRLVQLQVLDPGLADEALQYRMSSPKTIPAHRGRIVDRNGVVLATSVDRYRIISSPKEVLGFRAAEWAKKHGREMVDAQGNEIANGALGVAQLIGPLLGLEPMELAAQLNEVNYTKADGTTGQSQYLVVAKSVEPEVQRQIEALGLWPAVWAELVPQRIYPQQTTAGTLIGFTGENEESGAIMGRGGIEKRYEAELAGTDGYRSYERGANGQPIPGGVYDEVAAINGGDVILTIDANIQAFAQQVIDEVVEKFGAEHGIIIVQHVGTGELWAVADAGGVNPNDRTDARIADGSRAVTDTFEPGSTGKVITMAAALETEVVTPYTQFRVPYRYETPNGMSFHDSKEHPDWQLTATGILAKSSNTGTVQIAEGIPRATQYEYLKKFHLGEFTGLELAGESRGKIHPYEEWDGRTRYAVAFGQGLTVNAIQATGVYATVANNGVYTAPSLVMGIRNSDSNQVVPAEQPAADQAIAPETAATLIKMLEQATADDGTAKLAQVPGYRVAGKTGTAELIMPGRTTIMASFIGVAPADNPQFVVSVFVNAPQWGTYGGTVAAPAFSQVMGFILQQQGIAPSQPEYGPFPIYWGKAAE